MTSSLQFTIISSQFTLDVQGLVSNLVLCKIAKREFITVNAAGANF